MSESTDFELNKAEEKIWISIFYAACEAAAKGGSQTPREAVAHAEALADCVVRTIRRRTIADEPSAAAAE